MRFKNLLSLAKRINFFTPARKFSEKKIGCIKRFELESFLVERLHFFIHFFRTQARSSF